jgi:hypothetical protein
MTRFKALFAAAVVAAVVAVVPAASAQSACGAEASAPFHYVGAGSSAQYTMAALAADQAALNYNAACYGGGETVAHWDFNNGAQVADNRDSLNRILPEVGNLWIVWLTNASGSVTDVWTDLSVDSTVGVRTYSAQQTGASAGSGGLVQLLEPAGTVGQNKIGSCSGTSDLLWPDNQCDTALPSAVVTAFGGVCSNSNNSPVCTIGPHVNVGLTDIRPEDALYATTRALAKLNTTTWAGLGYVGPTANIGAPIYTDQGTATKATPIKFALSGAADPISKVVVPAYTTIPIGAAPIVFIQNNGGASSYPTDVATGIVPAETGGPYLLANLFDGTSACTTTNAAFDSFSNGAPASHTITLFLREPLSGTMNATEFSAFRSSKNLDDSQEKGITNPFNAPYNPLNLSCAGGGNRERSIGTGEVVGSASPAYGVLGNPYSLGYIFWSFSNGHKLAGANFNYLTVDGVDPIGIPTTGQQFYNCTTNTCQAVPANGVASLWPAGTNSYPHLRDGSYKVWSIYRWLAVPGTDSNPTDPYGPIGVAQIAQDYVDTDVADFVPFQACPSGDSNTVCTGNQNYDGLSVYHSHFTQSAKAGVNGAATAANSLNGGNTLGTIVDSNGAVTGTAEAGGDMGGLIEGPFGITAPYSGYVEWHNTTSVKDGVTVAEVQWKLGAEFVVGANWVGCSMQLGNPNVATSTTIQGCPLKGVNKCNPTATVAYVSTANPASNQLIDVPYTVTCGSTVQEKTYPAATAPGVISKKQ